MGFLNFISEVFALGFFPPGVTFLLPAQGRINWGGSSPFSFQWESKNRRLCTWVPQTYLRFLSLPTSTHRVEPRVGGAGRLCQGPAFYACPPVLSLNPGNFVKLVLRVGKTGAELFCILWHLLSYALCSLWSLLGAKLLEPQRLLSLPTVSVLPRGSVH